MLRFVKIKNFKLIFSDDAVPILYGNSIYNKIVCKSLMWHPHMGN